MRRRVLMVGKLHTSGYGLTETENVAELRVWQPGTRTLTNSRREWKSILPNQWGFA